MVQVKGEKGTVSYKHLSRALYSQVPDSAAFSDDSNIRAPDRFTDMNLEVACSYRTQFTHDYAKGGYSAGTRELPSLLHI